LLDEMQGKYIFLKKEIPKPFWNIFISAKQREYLFSEHVKMLS